MTSSNRVQVALVRETTAGTTPTTPRMRTMRITGESLTFGPEHVDSDEIRSDRMASDPIQVMTTSGGGINFEWSHPQDESPLSELIRSAMFAVWSNTNARANDGTADSIVTGVAATGGVFTVTTGTAFVVGQLVRTTGFTNAGNNGIFKLTTGSATVPAVGNSLLTDEAAPPADARIKVVGFQGASGDITATATGLGSTTLDFTTLGLSVGQVIKIGGTATGDKFATAALNAWVRITAIAANALTLDNRPSGWTTDSGTGKTIKVWVGDVIKNGTTATSLTIERGFLAQTTPTYIVNTGMQVGSFNVALTNRATIKGSATFSGMGGSQSTTALDASPDAETTDPIMAANVNTTRLTEAGSALSGPNWCRSLDFTINNNLRMIEAIDSSSPVGIQPGECTVTGKFECYFGDNTLLAKFYAGTTTSILSVVAKSSRAFAINIPRVTFRGDGSPKATGKNTDVMQSFDFSASKDSATSAHILLNRLEYFE